MTLPKSVTYIHPRARNLSHVNAISNIVGDRIAVSKEPGRFARLLPRMCSVNTYIIAGNLDYVAIAVMLILSLFPGRYVLMIGTPRTNLLHTWLINFFIKAKKARIAFITEYTRTQLAEKLGSHIMTAGKIVYHSSETADLALETADQTPWQKRDYDVLFFGRLNIERGLPEFLMIAEELPQLRFAVAGSGPLDNSVAKAAARLDNIRFLGFVGDSAEKLAILLNSKVLFSNMRGTENFGISILEAVAAGAAVSCPRDYGPVAILGPQSPYLRMPNIDTQEKINHLKRLLASGVTPVDAERFHSRELRKRWRDLISPSDASNQEKNGESVSTVWN
jgi:glycosyltransferase involved in cell wall biosynthesis